MQVSSLILVPISFVFEHMATLNEMDRQYAIYRSEHMATLNEMDRQYAELAASLGIRSLYGTSFLIWHLLPYIAPPSLYGRYASQLASLAFHEPSMSLP